MDKSYQNSPIIIGGMGGSGTRVVAEILINLNYYLGNDLNVSLDYVLFSLLFKRSGWLSRNLANQAKVGRGLRLIQNTLLGQRPYPGQLMFLLNAALSAALFGRQADGRGIELAYLAKRLRKALLRGSDILSSHVGWGWKEPNSFLLVEHYERVFPHYRYIHTIRHGLDMAFSDNQQQLKNWGHLFGIEKPAEEADCSAASYQYWVRTNQMILDFSKQAGPKKVLLVRYDDLCTRPEETIRTMLDFLDIDVGDETFRDLLRIPRPPESLGRYQDQDISHIPAEDLEHLALFGFNL